MCEPARQFSPGCHSLALYQTIPLFRQLAGHVIEVVRQSANLIVRSNFHLDVPISCGNLGRGGRQLFDGPGDAGCNPQTRRDREQNAHGSHAVSDGANVLLQFHQTAP